MSTGQVYIAQADNGLYKIGSSAQPHKRICELACREGLSLELVHTIPQKCRRAAFELETALHHLFSDKRVHGEWFSLDKADLATIRQIDTTPPFNFVPPVTMIDLSQSIAIKIALDKMSRGLGQIYAHVSDNEDERNKGNEDD